ncbi:MAG: PepSY-associated TM helix domain-containing protein [Methylococcaceae bacterium]
MRRFWLAAHLYLGLTLGFFFAVLGVTGSINVFMFELEELALPAVQVASQGSTVTLDDVVQRVTTAYPEKNGKWCFNLPGYGMDYIWAEYPKPVETADELYAPFRVLIDPFSGKITAESYWGQTVWSLVFELHAALMLGKLGVNIGQIGYHGICFLGLFLVLSALTGLYLWWPRVGKLKSALTLKWRSSPERFYYDVHKTAGIYAAIFLLMLGFTGFSFAYADYIKPLVRNFSSIREKLLEDPDVKSTHTENAQRLAIAKVVALATRVFPQAELRSVDTPDGKAGVYTVSLRQPGEANQRAPRSKVWLDQYSGQILAVQDPNQFTAGETFFNVLFPLHTGEALGPVGRMLWCVLGLVPAVLFITGILRWLQKRKAKRLAKGRQVAVNNGL